MSLLPIVRACGGDLYAGGRRANIPAPGHSPRDRSISLCWRDGRVVVHSFGGADWRDALAMLRGLGLVDRDNRLCGPGVGPASAPEPTSMERRAAARGLWEAGRPVAGTLSAAYLSGRQVNRSLPGPAALRHHGAAPIAVYADGPLRKPALLAGVLAPDRELCAVEVTYLDPGGRRARWPPLSRKTVGRVPPGSAVRLDDAAPEMVVAEGVVTALSASERFRLPAWALLAARNLAAWRAPEGVRRVLIAADRGQAGEAAARVLADRLRRAGLVVRMRLPPAGCGDWNDAAAGRPPG